MDENESRRMGDNKVNAFLHILSFETHVWTTNEWVKLNEWLIEWMNEQRKDEWMNE